MRHPLTGTVFVIGLLVSGALAHGARIAPAAAEVHAHGTTISVTAGGGGGGRRAPVYDDCHDVDLLRHLLLPVLGAFDAGATDVATEAPMAWRECRRIADGVRVGWIVGLPGSAAPPSSGDLAAAGQAELRLPLPQVLTSPPRAGTQLTGVPVWFWMDRPEPVSVTASIPGLSATLTATPRTSRYEISDGTVLRCADFGTPFRRDLPAEGQRSTCRHPFDERGPVEVAATVDWSLAWTATDGTTGTLPPVARTERFSLVVEEAQAVTD
jgi:hypothetical protein